MRRKRRLSGQETQWVEQCITEICSQEDLSPGDSLYRSAGWEAFLWGYQNCSQPWAPNFWPESFDRITEAVRYEKRVRTSLLYRELSLDRTLIPEAQETFLDRLPGGSGDFTNAVAFSDFLDRLPQELCRLSRSILSGYTLEETRSRLHWTGGELLSAVEDLRGALRAYEAT